MKDSELRGIVLNYFYENRKAGWLACQLDDLASPPSFVDNNDLFRACDQLGEQNLITWKAAGSEYGRGKITSFGTDVIEGDSPSPISIHFDQSRKISVSGSSNVQIGDSNTQGITIEVDKILTAINDSEASIEEKEKAKSLLRQLLESPIIASIAGGLASTIK
jgi:hypothetical protein